MRQISAPATRANIILYGYYGCGNLGDDLLLIGALAGLRRVFPGWGFLLRDHGDHAGAEALGPDVTFTGIETILIDRRGAVRRWAAYFLAWWRLLGQARRLVFGGGTLFHARGSLGLLTVQYLICLLARLRGVRIAALGVGISDLPTPIARFLLRRIIGLTDLFLVRDQAGLLQCAGSKARLTGDLVFGVEALARTDRAARDGKVAGLTVYPPACEEPHVVDELRESVRLLRARGWRVVFLVCQRDGVIKGDVTVFDRIAAKLKDEKPETRATAPDAASLDQAFSDIGVMCGMRYHGLMAGAMRGIPFVGLAHDNKIAALCQQFAMPCFDAARFGAARFAMAIDETAGRRPDPALLRQNAVAAAENFRLLAELGP